MKKGIRRILCFVLVAFCIVSQSGCGGKEPVSGSDFLLNTRCAITIYGGDQDRKEQEELIAATFALCRQYEGRLSRTIAASDIGKLNSAEAQPVEVDATTAQVIRAGLRYAELSGGLFDITVGGVAELWNFSGENPTLPDAADIAEAIKHVGYEKVSIASHTSGQAAESAAEGAVEGVAESAAEDTEEGVAEGAAEGVVVQLSDAQTKLDLGGIAKGYIADQAAAYLKANGVKRAILDFGGNIVCLGEKAEGQPFSIGVERPFSAEGGAEKKILGAIKVADKSVVTSGTYERKFYDNGTLYHHILDPKTGYPKETDLDGVSIVGPNSTDCDGLSTSCLMLGLEKGKELIDSLPEFEAVFITKDGNVVATDGINLEAVK